MQTCQLENIKELSQSFRNSLKNANILTVENLLGANRFELMKTLNCSQESLLFILKTFCKKAAPSHQTAFSMLCKRFTSNSFLSTSLIDLDLALSGGLPCGNLTEIAGHSASGKTQFCFTVCANKLLLTQGNILYIDTDSSFSAERLKEITEVKCQQNESYADKNIQEGLNRIFVIQPQTFDELINWLIGISSFLIVKDIDLIVLDSAASLICKEFGTSHRVIEARMHALSRQTSVLKKIAEDFQIPILLTNQVVAYKKQTKQNGNHGSNEDRYVTTAALGTAWAHDVTTRLLITETNGNCRNIQIKKSPISAEVSFACIVVDSGIQLS